MAKLNIGTTTVTVPDGLPEEKYAQYAEELKQKLSVRKHLSERFLSLAKKSITPIPQIEKFTRPVSKFIRGQRLGARGKQERAIRGIAGALAEKTIPGTREFVENIPTDITGAALELAGGQIESL